VGVGSVTATLLRVLVGSRAHGLHTEKSGWDWRTVYAVPTSELLSVGGHRDGGTLWQEKQWEGGQDVTGWEVGRFLSLAARCNPTILEVFAAPRFDDAHLTTMAQRDDGASLQDLFPHVWSPLAVRNAFVGYGLNQRKKFLEGKDGRGPKYAVAYLRVLYQAHQLLTSGVLPVSMAGTAVEGTLRAWRFGNYTLGEVIDATARWTLLVDEALETCAPREPNMDRINAFLLDVRRRYW
jgi:predicted nucleotidyltransferase